VVGTVTLEIDIYPTFENTFRMKNQHPGMAGSQAKDKWFYYAV
jgi:hypothetical protein